MMRFLYLSMLASVSCGMDISVKSSLSFDVDAAKNRPVSKVITLLKDMLKQLEKEAEEDEEIYDKMACWCETNDKEKTKAIADAEAKIADLTTKIEELTAGASRLGAEIKNLEKEVAQNQEALDKATAIREKQLAEFNAEEKDLLESISALKAAIVVLSKHHGGAFTQLSRSHVLSEATAIREKQLAEFNAEEKDLLESISALKAAIVVLSKHHGGAFTQLSRSHVLSVAATLQRQLQVHAALLQGVLTPSEKRLAAAFAQSPEDYFDAKPTFKQSYA
eukprot:CAMPEP_0172778004 /NCGR_PEP_ID=MMETSP1074-20121228/201688_1 /TAXON_ID=2916 /ORGANISM="Ceratium fusus, Strain PA161109" /LENGTH=277 /DNA_ID=CAMNT_0013614933 /DNA_START=82 /DNA_END=912 /DNA_ORIENTATION=+